MNLLDSIVINRFKSLRDEEIWNDIEVESFIQ